MINKEKDEQTNRNTYTQINKYTARKTDRIQNKEKVCNITQHQFVNIKGRLLRWKLEVNPKSKTNDTYFVNCYVQSFTVNVWHRGPL